LGTVFLNGQLIRETTLAKIREKLSWKLRELLLYLI
jgi:hypothetical protein